MSAILLRLAVTGLPELRECSLHLGILHLRGVVITATLHATVVRERLNSYLHHSFILTLDSIA